MLKTNAFQLTDHIRDIQDIAAANKCTMDVALQLFVANLATMKEHYKGASSVNYAQVGQKWNALNSQERNDQKAAARTRLARSTRGGSTE